MSHDIVILSGDDDDDDELDGCALDFTDEDFIIAEDDVDYLVLFADVLGSSDATLEQRKQEYKSLFESYIEDAGDE